MNVLGIQFDIAWEDKPANFRKVREMLAAAAPQKDSLVILPEMFATGFTMNTGAMAEAYGGATEAFLAGTARDFGVCLIAGAAMCGRDGLPRNKALVFSPAGGLTAFYAKMRPFTLGGEREHYTAGERPIAFKWKSCNIAPFICYDLRFPEIFRDAAAAHRPEVLVVIANWPDTRIHHWTRLLQARAIENQAYVIGVNRVGNDPFHHYSGHSTIIDPHGELMVEANSRETIIRATLDIDALREYRRSLPFLDDLRPAH